MDNDKFGFEGSHRRMFVQGPKFADGLTIAEPEDFITPGKPFDLLVSRTGTDAFERELLALLVTNDCVSLE